MRHQPGDRTASSYREQMTVGVGRRLGGLSQADNKGKGQVGILNVSGEQGSDLDNLLAVLCLVKPREDHMFGGGHHLPI